MGWLVWAEKYDLPQFAEVAKRYIVEHGGNIAICPEAKKLSCECLLWLLNARHVKKEDVEGYVRGAAPVCTCRKDIYGLYRKQRGLPPY